VVPGDTYRYAVNPFIADPVEALHFELQSARMSKIKNSELTSMALNPSDSRNLDEVALKRLMFVNTNSMQRNQ